MPKVDMPLDELRAYQGTNPKPVDFDIFWSRGIAEMKAVRPDVRIEPAAFKTSFADCYDMTFTGVRNARIYTKLIKPKGVRKGSNCPALILFHGYSMNSGDWTSMLTYAAEGFIVAALDCRGQGGLSQDSGGVIGNTLEGHIVRGLDGNPDDMLMRHIMLDAAQLAGLVISMDEVDPARVMASGASQGGGLTLACAALEPRIARLTPCYPFLCDYQRVWDIDLANTAYDELIFYFRRFDPRHLREREVFTQLGYVDVQFLSPRIQGDVLMACGLMDEVCPPSSQFAAYNKIKSKKEIIIYPDFRHENIPGWNDLSFTFITL